MIATTKAGERLLWMLATDKELNGRRWPRAFDARLVERIAQEFVPRIEEEAALSGTVEDGCGFWLGDHEAEWYGCVIPDAHHDGRDHMLGRGPIAEPAP